MKRQLAHPPARPRRARETTDPLMRIATDVLSRFKPPPELSCRAWADEYFYLPQSSPEPGKFNSARMPWLPGMLEDISNPLIPEHVWMFGSQLAKTTAMLAAVGYFTHWVPRSIMIKYPTAIKAEGFSKRKLMTSITETPVLCDLIKEAKGRAASNTIRYKQFPGGFIVMVGAESATELRGDSCGLVIQDEIDDDILDCEGQGDPVGLADTRAENFSNAVFIKLSSPTIKGSSRIEAHFNDSDKCYFFVPCPHCGHFQVLKWDNVKWLEADGVDAWYECAGPNCTRPWTDADRIAAIYKGEWRATAPFKGRRGRHLSGLYRVMGLKEGRHKSYLHEFVAKYLAKSKTEEGRKEWINTFLGETYDEVIERVEPDVIASRRESYTKVPNEVEYLIAGVDGQGGRLEVELIGVGPGEETWGCGYHVLDGDPFQKPVWDDLDQFLLQDHAREDGKVMKVYAAGIDHGYASKMVDAFCKPRHGRRVYAMKGDGGRGKTIVSASRRMGADKLKIYHVGDYASKKEIYKRLELTEPGPRYCHFAGEELGYTEAYFDGLTCEEEKERVRGTVLERYFECPEGMRNEPLDIRRYALAAMIVAKVHKKVSPGKPRPVEKIIVDKPGDAPPSPPKAPPTAPAQPKTPDLAMPSQPKKAAVGRRLTWG